jgi:hypothetical protein
VKTPRRQYGAFELRNRKKKLDLEFHFGYFASNKTIKIRPAIKSDDAHEDEGQRLEEFRFMNA